MKQSVILQIVAVLLVLHDFFYLPFSPFVLTIAAAAAAYGMTGSLVIPDVILFAAPIIFMLLKLMKISGFQNGSGAVAVSDRVKGIANKMPSSSAHDVSGVVTTGVLGSMGSSSVENFQTMDVSGGEPPAGLSGVSIPAYVREKGRLLVVPETSMARLESVDTNPRPSPALITGEDGMSVNAALTPDATQLPDADQQAVTASMQVGPESA
jgi:hypothetical protein